MSAPEDSCARIIDQAVKYPLGLFEALLQRLGNCEKEMEIIAKAPDFDGKRTLLVALEGCRYMHARLYETAPILDAIEQRGLRRDEVAGGLAQLAAVSLDNALSMCVAAELVGEHFARVTVKNWREQIAMRDEPASTRLEVPRTLAAIATLHTREEAIP